MQNINKIKPLIKERKLKIKDIAKEIEYSNSGFDKAIEFETIDYYKLIKLAGILGVDRNYFTGDTLNYDNNENSEIKEGKEPYGKIPIDDLLLKIIGKLDVIIDILNKQ